MNEPLQQVIDSSRATQPSLAMNGQQIVSTGSLLREYQFTLHTCLPHLLTTGEQHAPVPQSTGKCTKYARKHSSSLYFYQFHS